MAMIPTPTESVAIVTHSVLPLVSTSTAASSSLDELWSRIPALIKGYAPWLSFFTVVLAVMWLVLSACRTTFARNCGFCTCPGAEMCLNDTESDPEERQHPVQVVVNNYPSDTRGGGMELGERSTRSPSAPAT